jgi:hypothetical protein
MRLLGGVGQIDGHEDGPGNRRSVDGVVQGADGHSYGHENHDDFFQRVPAADGHQKDGSDRGTQDCAEKTLCRPKAGLLEGGLVGK